MHPSGLGKRDKPGPCKKLKAVARNLFQKKPTPEELAEHGVTWDDVATEYECDIWPCHLDAFNVFSRMTSQWRTSSHAVHGLDYGVLPFIFNLLSIPPEKQLTIFDQVRIMEGEAIVVIRAQQKEALEKTK